MTKFNVGDRVEFRATTRDTAYSAVADLSHLNGSLGTVVDPGMVHGRTIRVKWDSPSSAREAYENTWGKAADAAACFISNLVPAPSTPAATPGATLRQRALDLRDKARALEDDADALDRAADILDGTP